LVGEKTVSGSARRRLRSDLSEEQAVRLLTDGDLELEGRLREASNMTLRAFVTLDGISARCVYKPVSGERPLWDFPDGTLAAREVGAYLVSAATGWNVVPPTVLRDGPLGPGACQLWVETTTSPSAQRVGLLPPDELPEGWQPIASFLVDDGDSYLLAHADDPGLARIALLDAVINNADRKGGHVLHGRDGTLRGCDHGVCFHVEPKLRTVLWGFAGRAVDEADLAVLRSLREALDGPLRESLSALLTAEEVQATIERVDRLLHAATFPTPRPGRHVIPWPPV
jgi:uncharacterized repeat protein (TIGR03843 family)